MLSDGAASAVVVALGDGRFERRTIEAGPERDGHVRVLSGLAAGEHVVVDGAIYLERGGDRDRVMLGKLVDAALGARWAVLLLTATFVVAGLWAFRELPVEAFPDVTDTQVQVITLYPGHAPEEVERQVTLPIEKELNGTPQLTTLRSISIYGLSVVTVTFEDGTDNFFARSQVTERLRQVEVPDGVTPALGPLYTPIGEIYRYVLEADPRAGQSPMSLRELQDWVLERQLRQVPGVADVVSFGGFQRQFQVEVDPARLKAHGVTLRQVFDALQRSNANAGGNYLRRGRRGAGHPRPRLPRLRRRRPERRRPGARRHAAHRGRRRPGVDRRGATPRARSRRTARTRWWRGSSSSARARTPPRCSTPSTPR